MLRYYYYLTADDWLKGSQIDIKQITTQYIVRKRSKTVLK